MNTPSSPLPQQAHERRTLDLITEPVIFASLFDDETKQTYLSQLYTLYAKMDLSMSDEDFLAWCAWWNLSSKFYTHAGVAGQVRRNPENEDAMVAAVREANVRRKTGNEGRISALTAGLAGLGVDEKMTAEQLDAAVDELAGKVVGGLDMV